MSCDHKGRLRYARRIVSNGTTHYCVQCAKCLSVVKTKRHNYKLFIRHDEIPAGFTIHEWEPANV